MLAKLSLGRLYLRRFFNTAGELCVKCTPVLLAEPLKKKKKLDPQIIKQREEKRKKKLEKQIRRLERNARQLKPIDELEVPLELIDEKQKRARIVNSICQDIAERSSLQKSWALFKLETTTSDFQIIDRMLIAQQSALGELMKESEELFKEAILPDDFFISLKLSGPMASPPNRNYESPDGEYYDVTKKWD